MIDNARKGSHSHITSLADMTYEEDSFPEELYESLVELAAEYVAKPLPADRIQALRLAKSISCSFEIIRYLLQNSVEKPGIADGFLRIWPKSFTWAQYLRLAIAHMHEKDLDDAGEEICAELAEGISALVAAAVEYTQTTGNNILDQKVYDFVAAFWAARYVIPVEEDAANALRAFKDLENECLTPLVDAVAAHFGSLHDVVVLAKMRAQEALIDEDLEAMAAHYGVLELLLHELCGNPAHRAFVHMDIVPLVLDSMSFLLDATDESFDDRSESLMLCQNMMATIYSLPNAGYSYVLQSFRHGLVETYLKIGRIFHLFDADYQMLVSHMLATSIPTVMHLKPVLESARQDMTNYSRKQEHKQSYTTALQGDFKNVWRDFEVLIMEHSILRRIHALKIRRDYVYCGNVRSSLHFPSSTSLLTY